MMAAVAAFASSRAGLLHADVSRRFGVDPALGITDPIVAANLRVALAIRMGERERDAAAAEPANNFDAVRAAVKRIPHAE